MIRKNLLQKCHDGMHNWFWLGVVYDWDANPDKGRVWIYRDCAGTWIEGLSLEEFEAQVREAVHTTKVVTIGAKQIDIGRGNEIGVKDAHPVVGFEQ